MADSAEAFDVIVSADTLVYFGPLEEVVAARRMRCVPGGWLIFTVEERTSDAGYSSAARALPP